MSSKKVAPKRRTGKALEAAIFRQQIVPDKRVKVREKAVKKEIKNT